jgi:hypothetical protein
MPLAAGEFTMRRDETAVFEMSARAITDRLRSRQTATRNVTNLNLYIADLRLVLKG